MKSHLTLALISPVLRLWPTFIWMTCWHIRDKLPHHRPVEQKVQRNFAFQPGIMSSHLLLTSTASLHFYFTTLCYHWISEILGYLNPLIYYYRCLPSITIVCSVCGLFTSRLGGISFSFQSGPLFVTLVAPVGRLTHNTSWGQYLFNVKPLNLSPLHLEAFYPSHVTFHFSYENRKKRNKVAE